MVFNVIKRGQITSQALVYLTAIVVFSIILILGYKYISDSKESAYKGELALLKKQLIEDVKSISVDYGSFRKKTYPVPESSELCIFDLNKKNAILETELINFYPLIKDRVTSGIKENAFLVKSANFESFFIGEVELSSYPYFRCLRASNGKVQIGLEGLGNKSIVVTEFISTARLDPSKKVELLSPDGIIQLIIPEGTESNSDDISIEMVEPLPLGYEGASDMYKISPKAVTFSNPVQLIMRYNENAIGKCPSQLNYRQINEDGSEQLDTLSAYIDCDNKIAVFEISKFI